MALTKAAEAITDWTAVAMNAIGESGIINISGHYDTSLIIQAFLDTETAHTGTEFIVQVSQQAAGDEDWADYTRFTGLGGTANQEPLTNNPAGVGTTVLTCVSTTGFTVGDAELPWRAIKDGTLINSELILQVAVSANVSITVLDGTTNSHVQNTNMYSIALSKQLTLGFNTGLRARVVVNNGYDSNGSAMNYKVNIVKVTAL